MLDDNPKTNRGLLDFAHGRRRKILSPTNEEQLMPVTARNAGHDQTNTVGTSWSMSMTTIEMEGVQHGHFHCSNLALF